VREVLEKRASDLSKFADAIESWMDLQA